MQSTGKHTSSNNNLIFPSANSTSNPFFLPHCSPNYYFNQSTPFYFLRQQQNQQFTQQSTTPATNQTSSYNQSHNNQTPPTNENYYSPTMMFAGGQEHSNANSSNSSVAHQLNSPNSSFQLNASNHPTYDEQMNLSQTYTAYNSLSNHHTNAHSTAHSNVLNSYYHSNASTFPTLQSNDLANSRLMNSFINDNYSVNSLVSKSSSSSSVYTNSSTNHHFSNFKPQNGSSSAQKSTANSMSKLNMPQQHDVYSVGINQMENGYLNKKVTYNSLNSQLSLSNFKTTPNNQIDTSLLNTEHNLDLIKNSISYFNEQHQYQSNENSSNNIDIKPKTLINTLTSSSIYNDINGIRNNQILFELTKNCSSQIESANEFSPSALNYSTPNKLIQSLNSTGSTCSTMSSPTLSN